MQEHEIQNRIRNKAAGLCRLFRANVGTGWTSSEPAFCARKSMVVSLAPGDIVLRKARRFDTGLPPGFSDTFGDITRVITPEMVGQKHAFSLYGEVKQPGQKRKPNQIAFGNAALYAGALYGVWYSEDDMYRTIGHDPTCG